MRNYLAILFGKITGLIISLLHLGAGGTWPGEIALFISPGLLRYLAKQLKKSIVLVAGTNGKTTTSLMIKSILQNANYSVIHNASGANLLNGIISAFLEKTDWLGKFSIDYGVLEVDENSLPIVLHHIKPKVVICLNLFRDQLDRYGEVDTIAEKWMKSMKKLPVDTTVILNSDDPQIAYLGQNLKTKIVYFGLSNTEPSLKKHEHATDSIFCPQCGQRLSYEKIYFSHLGIWKCLKCQLVRPQPNFSKWMHALLGVYNKYNTLAAVAASKSLNIDEQTINKSLSMIAPAFGRQEEFEFRGKRVKIMLSKNPTGFNEIVKTVKNLNAKTILLALNDRIPDGRDVSWIWDVDFENMTDLHRSGADFRRLIITGDRCYDLGLRLKYSHEYQISTHSTSSGQAIKNQKLIIEPKLKKAISIALDQTQNNETLYILPTYSAMLEIRKILTGRKIL